MLLQLGAAYALLAVSYLCVQFLLGLHRRALRADPGGDGDRRAAAADRRRRPEAFAGTVLLIQAVTAVLLLGVSLARK